MEKFKALGVSTLKSWHDNDCVEVHGEDGNYYRLNATEILKLLNETKRTITFDKKTKHVYLVLSDD